MPIAKGTQFSNRRDRWKKMDLGFSYCCFSKKNRQKRSVHWKKFNLNTDAKVALTRVPNIHTKLITFWWKVITILYYIIIETYAIPMFCNHGANATPENSFSYTTSSKTQDKLEILLLVLDEVYINTFGVVNCSYIKGQMDNKVRFIIIL